MNTTSLGHIYKIICKVDEKFCYIGSTFNRLSKRMEEHRNGYNKWVKGKNKTPCSCFSYFQKYGIENFKIVLIKSYEVCRAHNKDNKHLCAYETLWINKTKCVNKNLPIDYLRLEKKRQYREANKDEIKEYNKEYYQKNKEERNAKNREYRKNHREELNAKQRERYEKNKDENSKKVECEFCESIVNKGGIARHQKTKKCLKAQGK